MHSRQIIGEKDSDGSLSLFTLLAFLHSVSLQQEVWGGKKKSLLFFCLDSNPVPPSLAVGVPVNSVHGGCHLGRRSLPLHSC